MPSTLSGMALATGGREATFSRQKPAASAAPFTTFGSKVDGIGLTPSG